MPHVAGLKWHKACGVAKSRSLVSNAAYTRCLLPAQERERERGSFYYTVRGGGAAANCSDNCTFEARKNCQTCPAAVADFAALININCMHNNNSTNMLLPCLCISTAVLITHVERGGERERERASAGARWHVYTCIN